MTANYLPKWQAVADDIISVLLQNPVKWIDTIEAGVTSRDMPPGYWRTVFKVAVDMAATQAHTLALMDTAIAIEAGPGITVEWVAERMALYDTLREGAFQSQLDTVKRMGAIHRAIEVLKRGAVQMTAAANNGLKHEGPMQKVMRELQAEQMIQSTASVGLDELLDENKVRMDADPVPTATTGLWLLDDWIGGLAPNEFVAWVAPYKSRKTSIMANVIIHRLRQGDNIVVFSLDERRANFIYRLEAMLMAEYMWTQKQYTHPLNNVSGKMLGQAGKKWKAWDKPLKDAFQYAWDTLAMFGKQCTIYDMATCRPTLESIGALSRVQASKKGGVDMIFMDHLQSLTGFKSIFDKVEEGSTGLHVLRGELDCRMWVLSQQNEEAIKFSTINWSPQVKGGGGLAAKADTVVMSKYKQGAITDNDKVRFDLSLARSDESQVYDYCEIHPASGWITPRRNVVTKTNIQEEQDKKIGVRQ